MAVTPCTATQHPLASGQTTKSPNAEHHRRIAVTRSAPKPHPHTSTKHTEQKPANSFCALAFCAAAANSAVSGDGTQVFSFAVLAALSGPRTKIKFVHFCSDNANSEGGQHNPEHNVRCERQECPSTLESAGCGPGWREMARAAGESVFVLEGDRGKAYGASKRCNIQRGVIKGGILRHKYIHTGAAVAYQSAVHPDSLTH